jgi:fructan beta-fructosidase
MSIRETDNPIDFTEGARPSQDHSAERVQMRRSYFATIASLSFAFTALCLAGAQNENFDQPYRPQVHFSPKRNWMNDPNGLVYYHGEYHLFFQYNPNGDTWGHMSWGHAVSNDLLHWKQLSVAIPEENGLMIFTGSVVIDHDDTSGLCKPAKECLVAIYTGDGNTPQGHRETQNLAYSKNEGRTWSKYSGNPVLDLHLSDFRDPNVSWDVRRHQWLMAVSFPREHKVGFYHSRDLKHWEHLSDFGPAGDTGGAWECPDLLQVPYADKSRSMWVLKVGLNPGAPQGGSGEQYFVGDFDGTTFHISEEPGAHGWTNYGKDDYCAISFNGIPHEDPPVLLGWMNNWEYAEKLPTSPWRGQMSLPRKLFLVRDQGGWALAQEPVISLLRKSSVPLKSTAPSAAEETIATLSPPYELEVDQFGEDAKRFGVMIYSDDQHWAEIGFDLAKQEFYIDRTRSGSATISGFPARTTAPLARGRHNDLKLIIDRSSVEAFAQQGTIAMTNLIYPPSSSNRVALFSSSPMSTNKKVKMWKLASIWQDPEFAQ